MLHIENRRSSTSWKFADILLEHPRLERPFSYYEKRALKNQLHERLRLISQGSIFHGNLLMVQVITFWIENNSRPLIVYKIFAELSENACSEFGWQVWREISEGKIIDEMYVKKPEKRIRQRNEWEKDALVIDWKYLHDNVVRVFDVCCTSICLSCLYLLLEIYFLFGLRKVKWCLSTTKSCFAREKPKLEVIVSVLHKSWLRRSAKAKRDVCVF